MKNFCGKICILVLLLCSSSLLAQAKIEDLFLLFPKAQHSPVIDAEMDLIWYNAPRYPMAYTYLKEIDSWYDLSGEWRVMWDDLNLYYLVEIRDDKFNIGSNWRYDSIEIYSDGDYSHGTDYDGVDDFQYRFHYGDTTRSVTPWTDGSGPELNVSGFVWEEVDTEFGYRMEVSIPFSDIFIEPFPWATIGMDVHYNDNDGGSAEEHRLITFNTSGSTSRDPSLMGEAFFSDWIVSDTLRVAKTNTQPTIDGELDPVWDEVSIVPVYSILDFTALEDYADLSAEFSTMWDANYLYYFIKVWDKDLTRDGTDDDCVLIYSDGDYSHGQDYDGKDDFQFDFGYENSDQVIANVQLGGKSTATAADLSGVLQAAKIIEGGLTLELAFPIQSLLGITPVAGSIYGIEVGYNDDDDGGEIDTKLRTYSKTDEINPSDMVMAKLIGDHTVTVDNKEIDQLPVDFSLEQNYPNPFNPWTTINYRLPEPSDVELAIYNSSGQKITTLINQFQNSGTYSILWDTKDHNGNQVPSGIYICKLGTGSQTHTKKMTFIR